MHSQLYVNTFSLSDLQIQHFCNTFAVVFKVSNRLNTICMKKVISILFILFLTLNIFAQKGISQFAIFGGYEHFPELWEGKGYDIGIEFKHYIHHRIYVLTNFHAGVNDGDKWTEYDRDNVHYRFQKTNSVRDYMLGFGIGGDILHIKKHKIYVQGTAGLGTSDQSVDGITTSPTGAYDILKTFEEKSTRFAISASAGYDYQFTDWLAIGINYTGWQIGYEYKNSFNAKLSLIF